MNQFSHLQLEIKPPKFSNEILKNPMEFLNEYDRFCQIKRISNENKKLLVVQCCKGKARTWAGIHGNFETYDAFKTVFLEEFYSPPIRTSFKKMWSSRTYYIRDGPYQAYCYRQLKDAEYFITRLSNYEANYTITTQFPAFILRALASVNFNNSTALAQSFAILDSTNGQNQIPINENSYQNLAPPNRYQNSYPNQTSLN